MPLSPIGIITCALGFLHHWRVSLWSHAQPRCPLQYQDKVWYAFSWSSLTLCVCVSHLLFSISWSQYCIVRCFHGCNQQYGVWLYFLWTLCKCCSSAWRSNGRAFCSGTFSRHGIHLKRTNCFSMLPCSKINFEIVDQGSNILSFAPLPIPAEAAYFSTWLHFQGLFWLIFRNPRVVPNHV